MRKSRLNVPETRSRAPFISFYCNLRAIMFTPQDLRRKKTYSYLRKEEKFHCMFVKPVLACRERTAIPLSPESIVWRVS